MLHNDALTFKIYLRACKRLLDLDTLNGHLNIQSSNRDYIDTNLNSTKGPTKSLLYNDNLENNVLVDYKDFMRSRFHSLTSLPSQKSVVSNFGQHGDHKFWQMTTNSSFDINYDRDEMKPLKHQWNKMLGPVSLSGVDVFSIQYDCINGNLTSMLNIYSIYFIKLFPKCVKINHEGAIKNSYLCVFKRYFFKFQFYGNKRCF